MRKLSHLLSNRAAALFMKLLFGYSSRVYVIGREKLEHSGALLLASNHISHFDPFIISSVVRRKIDWMTMAEWFRQPLLRFLLRAVDAFPADRHHADRATIRTAIERLKNGHIVGLFPEGGIRDGSHSLLEGAPLRRGAATLAHIAAVPIVPCVIIGSDRLYSPKRWLPLRRTSVWIAFGDPIPHVAELPKAEARARLESDLGAAFQNLYADLQRTFRLMPDDLPHSPRERFYSHDALRRPAGVPQGRGYSRLRRFASGGIDALTCASMNVLHSRHRLNGQSREKMQRYVIACEKLTADQYYSANESPTELTANLARTLSNGLSVAWRSPISTQFAANNISRAEFFQTSDRGFNAPTVFLLHSLMSASRIGYRRWASQLNNLGWNVCFVHLPYHYSRAPRGYWTGELAITPDLIRNAEALRQGVAELRQLISALRETGCRDFGVLGTSYGAWIGALLAMVERDLRFVALMAPIVNVEHAIWESPASRVMRRRLRRAKIEPSLIARHFHLCSPLHNRPLCDPSRVLFVAGEFDLISPREHIEAIHQKWLGSELLYVPQGHFGYQMMRDTIARLQQRGL